MTEDHYSHLPREVRQRLIALTVQCEKCHGTGILRAKLLATPKQIYAVADLPEFKNEPVPIQQDICPACQGVGRLYRG